MLYFLLSFYLFKKMPRSPSAIKDFKSTLTLRNLFSSYLVKSTSTLVPVTSMVPDNLRVPYSAHSHNVTYKLLYIVQYWPQFRAGRWDKKGANFDAPQMRVL